MNLIDNLNDFILTDDEEKDFYRNVKIAVLHQMYHQGLLTTEQLNALVKLQYHPIYDSNGWNRL